MSKKNCKSYNVHGEHTWYGGFLGLAKYHCSGLVDLEVEEFGLFLRGDPVRAEQVRQNLLGEWIKQHKHHFAFQGRSEDGYKLIWQCRDCELSHEEYRGDFYLKVLGWYEYHNFCGNWEVHWSHRIVNPRGVYLYICRGLHSSDIDKIRLAIYS